MRRVLCLILVLVHDAFVLASLHTAAYIGQFPAVTCRDYLRRTPSHPSPFVAPSPSPSPHGLMNYIDTKANCRHLKKLTWEGDFAAGFYLSVTHCTTQYATCTYSHREGGEGGRENQGEG